MKQLGMYDSASTICYVFEISIPHPLTDLFFTVALLVISLRNQALKEYQQKSEPLKLI